MIVLAVQAVIFAVCPPNITLEGRDRFDPAIVTRSPPNTDPLVGVTELTEGAGCALNVKARDRVTVPAGVLTVTSYVPARMAGVITVTLLAVQPAIFAAFPPNSTDKGRDRFDPVIFTLVPPEVGPARGLTLRIEGAILAFNVGARKRVAPVTPPDLAGKCVARRLLS